MVASPLPLTEDQSEHSRPQNSDTEGLEYDDDNERSNDRENDGNYNEDIAVIALGPKGRRQSIIRPTNYDEAERGQRSHDRQNTPATV